MNKKGYLVVTIFKNEKNLEIKSELVKVKRKKDIINMFKDKTILNIIPLQDDKDKE